MNAHPVQSKNDRQKKKRGDLRIGIYALILLLVISVTQLFTGVRMFRRGWGIEGFVQLLLPKDYESLANGLSTLLIGVPIMLYMMWRHYKKED